ncbi:DUF1492 domain-containing protein [Emergencia sp. JLR.KK010]|uniref:DUF1492 domain-containing protein n=1 Tax=Emergencia sp. JLR.KK010 TaxID=3114296 RepID=UPI0030D545A4
MEAKQFLKQYQETLVDIRNFESQKQELENLAMGITVSTDGERVQSSGRKDRMAELAVKIADAEREIMEQRTQAFHKLWEIEEVIKGVKTSDYRKILHMRYIENQTWEKIAVALNYSYQWACKLHGRALLEVEKILRVDRSLYSKSDIV